MQVNFFYDPNPILPPFPAPTDFDAKVSFVNISYTPPSFLLHTFFVSPSIQFCNSFPDFRT
jgi:hypothetical protein